MLTDTQVPKLCKAFANGSTANIKFSKTQLFIMIQSGRYTGMFNPINAINPFKVLSKLLIKQRFYLKKWHLMI